MSKPSTREKAERPELDVTLLGDSFVECRTLGHSWTVASKGQITGSNSSVSMRFVCSTCMTNRYDTVRTVGRFKGELLARKYDYPDGYRQPKFKAPARTVFRFELVRRYKP